MYGIFAFIFVGWNSIWLNVPASRNGKIAITSNFLYFAVVHTDSIYIYNYTSGENLITQIWDTSGIFSLSADDSILNFVHTKDTLLEVIKIKAYSVETTYTLLSPEPCKNLKLYNDGMVYPSSEPEWYLICQGENGIYASHYFQALYETFQGFDTVISENTTNFDFTSSRDNRTHITYATANGKLFLRNGNLTSFDTLSILIDSMLPDTPHVTITSKGDTIFIAYERISSQSLPDKDIYSVTYYFEGNDEPVRINVSASLDDEILPQSVMELNQPVDTVHVFYLLTSNPEELNEAIFPSPYNSNVFHETIFTGNIRTFHLSNLFNKIGILITMEDNSTVLLTNYGVGTKERKGSFFSQKGIKPGVYSIDGRKLNVVPTKGLFIKNGQKILRLP